jgi:hypothetical protein
LYTSNPLDEKGKTMETNNICQLDVVKLNKVGYNISFGKRPKIIGG